MKIPLIAIVLLLVGVRAFGQSAPQPVLKITVLTDKVNDTSDQVTIRFLNQSTHNLSFPRPQLSCVGGRGTLTVEAFIVELQSPYEADESCGLEGRDWPPPTIPEILEQAKGWLLLHPQESADINLGVLQTQLRVYKSSAEYERHTMLTARLEEPGFYKLRAIYNADFEFLANEQRQALQHAGYFVPSGTFESDRVDLRVSAELVKSFKNVHTPN